MYNQLYTYMYVYIYVYAFKSQFFFKVSHTVNEGGGLGLIAIAIMSRPGCMESSILQLRMSSPLPDQTLVVAFIEMCLCS